MKYRPEIDGLRAIAVISVILFHAGFSTFSGGYVGVDVFFVISGYLITTIIASELENNKFSIVNFYERRARRIMPMLFFLMIVTTLYAWVCLLPSDMKGFSDSLIAVSTFSSNILFWSESGYWDTASELKPLLHTWSLAVEEQFYLLFPLFLMITCSFKKYWIIFSIVLIAGFSIATAQWGAFNEPNATFYLLPTRIWELAIGAVIATIFVYYESIFLKLISNKFINEVLGLIGLLMIFYSIFALKEETPFPSLYALVPTVGTGLIILYTSSQTLVGRLLSIKPLVLIGLISYSAYLWHQPLLAFARYQAFPDPPFLIIVSLVILVFPLSYLSWKFVETPFRNKKLYTRKKVFLFSLIGSLVFIIFGSIGHYTGGFDRRSVVANQSVKNYQPDNLILRHESWKALRELAENDKYIEVGNNFDDELWFHKEDDRQKLLLIGNSHSKDLYNIFMSSEQTKVNFEIARYGLQIDELINPKHSIFESPNYKLSDIVVICSKYRNSDLEVIETVVKKLINDGKAIVIIRNIFEFQTFGVRTLADFYIQRALAEDTGISERSIPILVENIDKEYYKEYVHGKDRIRNSDIVIDAMAKKYKEIIVLDRMDYICDNGKEKCFSLNEQLEKYFYDYGHHTSEGAAFFGKRIDDIGWLVRLNNQ